MSRPARHFCFTAWNKPKDNLGRYMIYGIERCPKTGNEHYQGYIELDRPMRMAGVKKLFEDNTIHLETRKGTRDQAREYCKKDGNFSEFGTWIKGQGHRSDLETVALQLVAGETKLEDVMTENPVLYCKYRNGLKDLAGLGMKNKTKEYRHVEVVVISGPTGCGKTRGAIEESKEYYKIGGSDLAWFDGYAGEETLIIDEYNNDVGVTKLLDLLAGHQLRLPMKGSFTYAAWNKVYITTNLTKREIHERARPAHRNAMFRRITEWRDMWE